MAAVFGHEEVIRLLVEGGAQLSVQNNVGLECWVGDYVSQAGRRPLQVAAPGSSTFLLLEEMEMMGADETTLIK